MWEVWDKKCKSARMIVENLSTLIETFQKKCGNLVWVFLKTNRQSKYSKSSQRFALARLVLFTFFLSKYLLDYILLIASAWLYLTHFLNGAKNNTFILESNSQNFLRKIKQVNWQLKKSNEDKYTKNTIMRKFHFSNLKGKNRWTSITIYKRRFTDNINPTWEKWIKCKVFFSLETLEKNSTFETRNCTFFHAISPSYLASTIYLLFSIWNENELKKCKYTWKNSQCIHMYECTSVVIENFYEKKGSDKSYITIFNTFITLTLYRFSNNASTALEDFLRYLKQCVKFQNPFSDWCILNPGVIQAHKLQFKFHWFSFFIETIRNEPGNTNIWCNLPII